MKRRGVSVLAIIVSLFGMGLTARAIDSQPVTPTQIAAWLTGGVSNARLVRIIQERGVAEFSGKEEIKQLEAAGADQNLIASLKKASSRSAVASSDLTALQANPGTTRNLISESLLKAAVDARAQRFAEAEAALRDALKADPENAALHFALGAMLQHEERWDDAFDEITISTKLMPDLPENHNSFAYIFYRLDDGPNAVAEARTALSMDPQNSEGYQFLGLALYSSMQYAGAVHAFLESLARDGDNADTYYDLGVALHDAGNMAGAIDAYRQAIRLKPAFWQAHSNLALTFHEQRNLDEAIAEYAEAKQLAPQEASVRNNLGNTYCDRGDFDAAIKELQELYREHPEWTQGHICMAHAYMAKKQYAEATTQFQLAVQENPTGSSEHRMLGEALLMTDRLEDGVRELRLAVELDPDSDSAHRALGTALFRQQQLPAAEKEFREALRLNPSSDNHYSLAACLMTMDRYEEALAELETAARLDPERSLYRARRDELMKLMKETNSR